jgi:hypothetical protein
VQLALQERCVIYKVTIPQAGGLVFEFCAKELAPVGLCASTELFSAKGVDEDQVADIYCDEH